MPTAPGAYELRYYVQVDRSNARMLARSPLLVVALPQGAVLPAATETPQRAAATYGRAPRTACDGGNGSHAGNSGASHGSAGTAEAASADAASTALRAAAAAITAVEDEEVASARAIGVVLWQLREYRREIEAATAAEAAADAAEEAAAASETTMLDRTKSDRRRKRAADLELRRSKSERRDKQPVRKAIRAAAAARNFQARADARRRLRRQVVQRQQEPRTVETTAKALEAARAKNAARVAARQQSPTAKGASPKRKGSRPGRGAGVRRVK